MPRPQKEADGDGNGDVGDAPDAGTAATRLRIQSRTAFPEVNKLIPPDGLVHAVPMEACLTDEQTTIIKNAYATIDRYLKAAKNGVTSRNRGVKATKHAHTYTSVAQARHSNAPILSIFLEGKLLGPRSRQGTCLNTEDGGAESETSELSLKPYVECSSPVRTRTLTHVLLHVRRRYRASTS